MDKAQPTRQISVDKSFDEIHAPKQRKKLIRSIESTGNGHTHSAAAAVVSNASLPTTNNESHRVLASRGSNNNNNNNNENTTSGNSSNHNITEHRGSQSNEKQDSFVGSWIGADEASIRDKLTLVCWEDVMGGGFTTPQQQQLPVSHSVSNSEENLPRITAPTSETASPHHYGDTTSTSAAPFVQGVAQVVVTEATTKTKASLSQQTGHVTSTAATKSVAGEAVTLTTAQPPECPSSEPPPPRHEKLLAKDTTTSKDKTETTAELKTLTAAPTHRAKDTKFAEKLRRSFRRSEHKSLEIKRPEKLDVAQAGVHSPQDNNKYVIFAGGGLRGLPLHRKGSQSIFSLHNLPGLGVIGGVSAAATASGSVGGAGGHINPALLLDSPDEATPPEYAYHHLSSVATTNSSTSLESNFDYGESSINYWTCQPSNSNPSMGGEISTAHGPSGASSGAAVGISGSNAGACMRGSGSGSGARSSGSRHLAAAECTTTADELSRKKKLDAPSTSKNDYLQQPQQQQQQPALAAGHTTASRSCSITSESSSTRLTRLQNFLFKSSNESSRSCQGHSNEGFTLSSHNSSSGEWENLSNFATTNSGCNPGPEFHVGSFPEEGAINLADATLSTNVGLISGVCDGNGSAAGVVGPLSVGDDSHGGPDSDCAGRYYQYTLTSPNNPFLPEIIARSYHSHYEEPSPQQPHRPYFSLHADDELDSNVTAVKYSSRGASGRSGGTRSAQLPTPSYSRAGSQESTHSEGGGQLVAAPSASSASSSSSTPGRQRRKLFSLNSPTRHLQHQHHSHQPTQQPLHSSQQQQQTHFPSSAGGAGESVPNNTIATTLTKSTSAFVRSLNPFLPTIQSSTATPTASPVIPSKRAPLKHSSATSAAAATTVPSDLNAKREEFLRATMKICLVVSPPSSKLQLKSKSLTHLDGLDTTVAGGETGSRNSTNKSNVSFHALPRFFKQHKSHLASTPQKTPIPPNIDTSYCNGMAATIVQQRRHHCVPTIYTQAPLLPIHSSTCQATAVHTTATRKSPSPHIHRLHACVSPPTASLEQPLPITGTSIGASSNSTSCTITGNVVHDYCQRYYPYCCKNANNAAGITSTMATNPPLSMANTSCCHNRMCCFGGSTTNVTTTNNAVIVVVSVSNSSVCSTANNTTASLYDTTVTHSTSATTRQFQVGSIGSGDSSRNATTVESVAETVRGGACAGSMTPSSATAGTSAAQKKKTSFLQRKKPLLTRSEVSSAEFFSVSFNTENGQEHREDEFIPARKGITLASALSSALKRRNLCFSQITISDSNATSNLFVAGFSPLANSLDENTDVENLAGHHLVISDRDSSRKTLQKAASFGSRTRPPRLLSSASTEESTAGGGVGSDCGTLSGKQPKQRWSGLFGIKNPQQNQLCELLNAYAKQGVPQRSSSLNFDHPNFDAALEYLDNMHRSWKDFVESDGMSDIEMRIQTAIWELVTTEVYYIHALQTVTDLFLACLEAVQEEHLLKDVDQHRLFSNVREICEANLKFWTYYLHPMVAHSVETHEPMKIRFFQPGFGAFGTIFAPYKKYCAEQSTCQFYCKELNRNNALFTSYLAWCESQKMCNRLRLADILVRPMQRLTKYSLLLSAVRKHLSDVDSIEAIDVMIHTVENFVFSVNNHLTTRQEYERLRGVMARIESYDVVDTNNEQLEKLIRQYSQMFDLCAPMKGCAAHHVRHLFMEGDHKFKDAIGKADVHCFLLTDMLLVCKGVAKKGVGALKVIRQPYVTDRLHVQNSGTNSLNCVYVNEFHVVVSAFVLQCSEAKNWYEALKRTKMIYTRLKQGTGNWDASRLGGASGSVVSGGTADSLGIKKSPMNSSICSHVSSANNSHSGSVEWNDSRNISVDFEKTNSLSSDEGSSLMGGNSGVAGVGGGVAACTHGIVSMKGKSLVSPAPNKSKLVTSSANTLSVQPVSHLGQSLPNLNLHHSHTNLYRTYSNNTLLVPGSNTSHSGNLLLSPSHRGISYPPPSPTRVPLRRGMAFSTSTKNPPLVKTRNINSEGGIHWHQTPATPTPPSPQSHHNSPNNCATTKMPTSRLALSEDREEQPAIHENATSTRTTIISTGDYIEGHGNELTTHQQGTIQSSTETDV